MIIAFDVDNTLIDEEGTPIYENIDIYRWFQERDDRMIVWSGGGEGYARKWAEKLGLEPDVICSKNERSAETHMPDIVFDDEIINLGKVNIRV